MRVRTLPKPQVMAAGALEDGGRYLFILRRAGEKETVELPHAIIPQGSDPLPALKEVFLLQLGIDAQAHEPIFHGRHNAGSRKCKRWVPALVFRMSAKRAGAKPAPGLDCEWLKPSEARKRRLARNAEWLFG